MPLQTAESIRSCQAAATAPRRSVAAVPDAVLVAAAQADLHAFDALYDRYVAPVYRYCYRRLGGREAAEDATSAVFERALAALPRYREGNFRAWPFTIAHNVAVNEVRRRSDVQLDAVALVDDPRADPERAALVNEERRHVRELLAGLPPDQREVVELCLAGLTGEEIARVLGRGRGAVKSAQFRALRNLRRMVAGAASGEEADHVRPE